MKTPRPKCARALRKWADLIDPRIAPSGPDMTLRITCDATETEETIARLSKRLEELHALLRALQKAVGQS